MARLRRARLSVREGLGVLGRATLGQLVDPGLRARWLRHVPNWPTRRRFPAPWSSVEPEVPEQLRTVPGIWRDPEAEQRAYEEGPQYSFMVLHSDSAPIFRRYGWSYWIPALPRMQRIGATIRQLIAEQPTSPPPAVAPQALTDELRREAQRPARHQERPDCPPTRPDR